LEAFTSRSNDASPNGLKDNSDNRYIENIVVLCVHEHGAAGGHRYIENIAISDIVTSRVNCRRCRLVAVCGSSIGSSLWRAIKYHACLVLST
jgi:hypothetical protein